ncbi:MAG TPA: hypothetical protein VG796_06940 [Verrucomicrobiales bacterium]|nr:hypothetical protein [Verrucomicrobiales bacterium]
MPRLSPEDELKLFRQVVWFVYTPPKGNLKARLHLAGSGGRLKDFKGRVATEVWERLGRWRHNRGMYPE